MRTHFIVVSLPSSGNCLTRPIGMRARIMARQIRVEYATAVYPSRPGATRARRLNAMTRTGSEIPCVTHRLQERPEQAVKCACPFFFAWVPAPLNHHLLPVRSTLWLGNQISYPLLATHDLRSPRAVG